MLNALTIDIEDYFQVHAFSNVVKYEDWDKFECRIERNTDRILEILKSVRSPRTSHHSNFNNNNSMNSSNPTNSLTQKNNDSSGLPPCAMPYAPCVAPRATFFILGWIGERYPDLIRRIQKEGHEIACHGYAHQLIYNQSRDEFRQDIKRAKAILEDITGSEVTGYRAPSYSITNKSQWALAILTEEGFKYDSSIFPIRHDFYGMPEAPRFPFLISLNGNKNFEFSMLNFEKPQHRSTSALIHSINRTNPTDSSNSSNPINSINSIISSNPVAYSLKRSAPPTSGRLVEFPISTVKLFGQNLPISGGGYFRLFPYPVIKKGLKRINEVEKKPFIFYMHPWEIDPNQPKINGLSSRSKFRHYINLDKTESKFRRLLRDFQFSTVKGALEKTVAP